MFAEGGFGNGIRLLKCNSSRSVGRTFITIRFRVGLSLGPLWIPKYVETVVLVVC